MPANRQLLGGYTIIEVLIVLAITGVILISAVGLINSLAPSAQFSQSMQDMKSKIESVVKGVDNTTYPATDKYNCSVVSGAPALTPVAAGTTHEAGTSDSCIFIGKALWIPPSPAGASLYIFSILGKRADASGANVTNYLAANPTAAVSTIGGELTEQYDAEKNQIRLISAKDNGVVRSLASFYNNLSASAPTYNQQSGAALLTRSYVYGGNYDYSAGQASTLQTCIRETGCNPQPMTKWDLCFDDFSSKHKALLSIINSGSGIVTVLKMENNCS